LSLYIADFAAQQDTHSAGKQTGMDQTTRQRTGLDAIAAMFAAAEDDDRAAFLPYFPVGYPTYEESIDAIAAMADVGVDGFEIGIPFSDPLADGPTIQAASQIALENGTTLKSALDAVRNLRRRGVRQPMLMMGYLNPLLSYGTERFVIDAKAAGADGLICPDLPPDEAHFFTDVCAREGMALVFLIAPNANDERIRLVAETATGFIYVVSLIGITGERQTIPPEVKDFIARIRTITNQPLVMGFGISKPEHARMMNGLVNGFIVGSALVRTGKDGVQPVRELARVLRDAINR
jgi:tryptophan synthase alpha chain